ncbi:MAG: SOS response-associated peptidase, partial [Asgard group archaeon]|nr:SOS response-associated peptidase [Asgard group archaeon]
MSYNKVMCYYISITVRKIDIESRFDAIFSNSESYLPAYSVSAFSYPLIPVISDDNPESIVLYHWGLIPFWVKDVQASIKIRQRTLNARA